MALAVDLEVNLLEAVEASVEDVFPILGSEKLLRPVCLDSLAFVHALLPDELVVESSRGEHLLLQILNANAGVLIAAIA